MPQMKPLNWLLISLTITISMISLISLLYFFTPQANIPFNSNNTFKASSSNWNWKW